MVHVILVVLTSVLFSVDKVQADSISNMIEECSGLEKIENLQNHPNEKISTQATEMLDQYFNDMQVEETVHLGSARGCYQF